MSAHLNGTAMSATVTGVAATNATLEGPGFRLLVSPHQLGTAVAVEGSPAPEQVLRLLAQRGVLVGAGDVVDAVIRTTAGHDRYVYTADLEHRLLFSRAWDREGLHGVFYGLNPFVADTDGPVVEVPGRNSFRNIVGVLAKQGLVAQVDVMNLFTRRTRDAATLMVDVGERVAAPDLERRVLEDADIVIPAWGSSVRQEHDPAVRDFLGVLADIGKVPLLRSKHGEILTSGTPPQPTHPRMEGYKSVDLVPAPPEWLAGGPLPAAASGPARRGVHTRSASPEDLDRFGTRSGSSSRETQQAPDALPPQSREAVLDVSESVRPPRSEDGPTEAWTARRPRPLVRELVTAGLDDEAAKEAAGQIRAFNAAGSYGRAIDALRILLRGDMPLLMEAGTHEAALWEVLPQLLRATRDPYRIAQSLLVGAVCSGGVGEYAAFLECSRPGVKARHKDREGLYPIPGIDRPQDTRLAYARLAGYSGSDDSEGTAARGDGRTLNRRGTPSPAQRYGWIDGPKGVRSRRQRT